MRKSEFAPSDTERLEWVLRYAAVKTLGTYQDFDYIPITLEIIDNAIAKEKRITDNEQP